MVRGIADTMFLLYRIYENLSFQDHHPDLLALFTITKREYGPAGHFSKKSLNKFLKVQCAFKLAVCNAIPLPL